MIFIITIIIKCLDVDFKGNLAQIYSLYDNRKMTYFQKNICHSQHFLKKYHPFVKVWHWV
ncbi:hypothetical protein B5J93_01750 [Moraxella equi]|uniref:Uncharacterized protein n=1 Tax=Moraxella equi TaxID=60442 RepID=A0ABX3NKH8_9GAMM|nr:hypothetical protein B5J93_01750 [Moraxella equi]